MVLSCDALYVITMDLRVSREIVNGNWL